MGYGILQKIEGDLPDETIDLILKGASHDYELGTKKIQRHYKGSNILYMDYIHGRGCKFGVWTDDSGKMYIRVPWYDHWDAVLTHLIEKIDSGALNK